MFPGNPHPRDTINLQKKVISKILSLFGIVYISRLKKRSKVENFIYKLQKKQRERMVQQNKILLKAENVRFYKMIRV